VCKAEKNNSKAHGLCWVYLTTEVRDEVDGITGVREEMWETSQGNWKETEKPH
jgi:hypothetical protein